MPTFGDIFDVVVEATGLSVFAVVHGFDHTVTWPVNPDKMTVDTGAKFVQIDTLRDGEHPFPRGRKATVITLTGTLPGVGRFACGFPAWVSDWAFPSPRLGPRVFVKRLADLQEMGEAGRSRLIVTRPYVNLLVYVEAVTWSTEGAFGDMQYTITLREARDVGAPQPEDPALTFPPPTTPPNPLDPGGQQQAQTSTVSKPMTTVVQATVAASLVAAPAVTLPPAATHPAYTDSVAMVKTVSPAGVVSPVLPPETTQSQATQSTQAAGGIAWFDTNHPPSDVGYLLPRQGSWILPDVYRCGGGETWTDISFLYYGTTTKADEIRRLNYYPLSAKQVLDAGDTPIAAPRSV